MSNESFVATCSFGAELEDLWLVESVIVLAGDPGQVPGLWSESLDDVLARVVGVLVVDRLDRHLRPLCVGGIRPGVRQAVAALPITHLKQ